MTNVAVIQRSDDELLPVLRNSLYPGAADDSIRLVLGYCRAAGLDPMAKPVHIVPMYDRKSGGMRDVVMPGIDLYRVKAARTGQYVGCSEPEFGPDVTQTLGGVEVTFPAWCKATVRRKLGDTVAEFTAVERWIENYATKRNDSAQPNAMWSRRPYGQLAKCAEAQALRKGFPEIGSGPTAEEMAGKSIDADSFAPPTATMGPVDQAQPSGPRRRSDSAPAATAPTIDAETGEMFSGEPAQDPAPAAPATSSAPSSGSISGGQVAYLRNKLKAARVEEASVCDRFQVASIELLSSEQFTALKGELLAAV